MKRANLRWWLAWLLTLAPGSAQEPLPQRESNYSLRNEVEISLDKGLAWLQLHQNADGSWADKDRPASTALALIDFLRQPAGKYRTEPRPDFLAKGFAVLRAAVQADGSISRNTIDTSYSLLAFLANGDPRDAAREKAVRAFLFRLQTAGSSNKLLNGGFSASLMEGAPRNLSPDLPSTRDALEALRTFKSVHPEKRKSSAGDANWSAAAAFVSRCQIPQNPGSMHGASAEERGGFVERPDLSNRDHATGSMSCAGLLSLIHAGVVKNDVRIVAVLDWLRRHYTLEENPGVAGGCYRYLNLMARSLAALDIRDLDLPDGRKIDWARDESLKLLDLQNADGSWVEKSSSGEPDNSPTLTTSLALLTLEVLYHRL